MEESIQPTPSEISQTQIGVKWKQTRVYNHIKISKPCTIKDDAIIFGDELSDIEKSQTPRRLAIKRGASIGAVGALFWLIGLLAQLPMLSLLSLMVAIYSTNAILFKGFKKYRSFDRLIIKPECIVGDLSWCPKFWSRMEIQTFEIKWSSLKCIETCTIQSEAGSDFIVLLELKRAVETDVESFDYLVLSIEDFGTAKDIYALLNGYCPGLKLQSTPPFSVS